MINQRGLSRFIPSRAGIINLWDYRDEEFLFVDGWLVLRGPNGSGKTKALEVLFPFVLDGRIEPRRLNPFASEDRTMKSNLLYRGQDVAYAYVWMEFRRPTAAGDGDEFVTIGIGLKAHRHVDRVTRWHFVTEGRVGVDFSLIDADDRPLNRRDLINQLNPDQVYDAADDYRHALDARLFGLGAARYEQLLDLVLTLRKPQLAKDLNPVELSRTLQRGLRPLDDTLIIEAAESFDDMEAVARVLEGLVAADEATAAFLAIYSTYLRTHARAAADGLTGRRFAAQDRRHEMTGAVEARRIAETAHDAANDEVTRAESTPGRLRAHLDRLKVSTAYQSHEQLADLKRHVDDLATAASRSQAAAAREKIAADVRATELDQARRGAGEAEGAVSRLLRDVAVDAEAAGIDWTADDGEADGFDTRIRARITGRRDDIRVITQHGDRLAHCERDKVRAVDRASTTRAAAVAAEVAEAAAEEAVDQARDRARTDIVAWRDQHLELLYGLGVTDAGDLVSGGVDRIGDPNNPSLREIFTASVASSVTRIRERSAELAAQSSALDDRRTATIAERDRIAAEHDDAPIAVPTRTVDRSNRAGAPLWRLVRFGDGLADADAAAVEAALEAAGLLDAWIEPDPAEALQVGDDDGFLRPLAQARRPSGPTLRDFLEVEGQTDVPIAVVEAVLESIAVRDAPAPAPAHSQPEQIRTTDTDASTVTLTGQYALGVLAGSHRKPAPEYIGATARAARRAARIADCELTIARLSAEIAELDRARDDIRATLAAVDACANALPSVEPILNARRHLDRAAVALGLRRADESEAAAQLDQALAEQAAAAAALRRAAAERRLAPDQVESVDEAVRRVEAGAARVSPARWAAKAAHELVAAAMFRHTEALDRHVDATTEAHEAAMRHEETREAFDTLSAAVDDADVTRVLAEVAETERLIGEAETRLTQLRAALAEAIAGQATARSHVDAAAEALRLAVIEERHESVRLRPFAHADLLGLLRCPPDLRWPAQVSDGEALPAEIGALHDAILAATRELNPTETSLKQSATRLSTALTELQAQLPAAGLDHRPEWDTDDGVIVVRIADEQGLTPVAHFAERIARERHDQEQLLSDAERRILEDALLTQLARQIHHRTIESRDLVDGMDSQMRQRRMSSGLTVGVGWHLADELDPDQREACKLLERDPARLGPGQLTTLRRHFATRIKAARAMAPELPYRELLGQVLDYRQWRTFKFTLHRPGGSVEPLTRARHSQLSGGEQSVSLHLPLFAAANALFGSARPEAPRMIGLDEAFAGVDENGRGELMSLAARFDLDLFMTGYDLWATHPAVAGTAHYDLSHSAIEHTVATVLLVWNGSATIADFDGSLARALGSPETRRVPLIAAGQPSNGFDLEVEMSD